MNYTVIRVKDGWLLTIYAPSNNFCTCRFFHKYINALRAVQMLQLHLTAEDKKLAA